VLTAVISAGAAAGGGTAGDGTGPGVTVGKDGDGYGGAGQTFEPVAGVADATVVLLHGLSAKVAQVAPLATIGQGAGMKRTRFILPQAGDAYVTYRDVVEPSWFNVDGTSEGATEHRDEILKAAARIERILSGERAKGVGKVAVVGMSQGGAVASTVYMRGKVPLAGAVMLATWLPLASSYPAEASAVNKALPAVMVHGGNDQVVALQWAQHSRDKMVASGRDVRLDVVDGASHTFDLQILTAANIAVEYLKGRGIN
jgi:phospholipase/carboxylesterase